MTSYDDGEGDEPPVSLVPLTRTGVCPVCKTDHGPDDICPMTGSVLKAMAPWDRKAAPPEEGTPVRAPVLPIPQTAPPVRAPVLLGVTLQVEETEEPLPLPLPESPTGKTGARASSGPWRRRRQVETMKRYGRRQINPVDGLGLLDGSQHDKTVRRIVREYGCQRSTAEAFLADASKAGLIDREPIHDGLAIGLFQSAKLLTWINREASDERFRTGLPLKLWRRQLRSDEKFARDNGFSI